MKKNFLSLFVFAVLISACTPPVVFENAYPVGEEDLMEILPAYIGIFVCESDGAIVDISKHHVTLRRENYFMLPIKDIEERQDCKIDGKQMYVSGRSECIPVEFINDSIVKGTVIENDTLFVMGDGSVARSYNGHIVLSQELKKGEWAVSLLSLDEDQNITYRAITDKTKIKHVGKITSMEDITTIDDKKDRYKIKPSMIEFDELIKDEKIFIECEYLTRVNFWQ